MFGSTLLDVAIGLVFIYLLVSLVCSAANEVLEGWLKKRATDLEKGIRELFQSNSKIGDTDLVEKLYNHPLIQGLYKGTYDEFVEFKKKNPIVRFLTRFLKGPLLPSYIPARSFALALMDTVLPASTASGAPASPPASPPASAPASGVSSGATAATPAAPAPNVTFTVAALPGLPPSPLSPANPLNALRNAVGANSVGPAALLTPQASRSLLTFIDAAGADVSKARESIENWFNNSMDRVSGWYKRRTQVVILIMGFSIAAAFNIDSIVIVKRLSTDKSLRDSIVKSAEEYAKANAAASMTSAFEPGDKQTSPGSASQGDAGNVGAPARREPSVPGNANRSASSNASLASLLPQAGTSPSPNSSASPESSPSPPPSASTSASPSGAASTSSEAAAAKNGACKDPNSPECKFEKSKQDLQGLGLPIGWDNKTDQAIVPRGRVKDHPREWLLKLLGWLITALAVSLGAPFWFDVLNKIIVVRSTVKPHEKSPEEPSKQ